MKQEPRVTGGNTTNAKLDFSNIGSTTDETVLLKQQTEGWEERFDKEFVRTGTYPDTTILNTENPKGLKDFIRAEIEAARREAVEEGYKHGWEYSRYANRRYEARDQSVEEFFRYDSSTNLIPLKLDQLKQKYLNN